jgi:purine-binding chemotaxis protein CheW
MMANNTTVDTKQYIIINFDDEQYGINIQYVQNIVRMQHITRVPKAPSYIKGVINLRGEIIPVMSLRQKFDLEEDIFTHKTRIIITTIDQHAMGLIVDEVKEVIQLSDDVIEKFMSDVNDEKSSFLSGVGKYGDDLISILSLNAVIAEKENN